MAGQQQESNPWVRGRWPRRGLISIHPTYNNRMKFSVNGDDNVYLDFLTKNLSAEAGRFTVGLESYAGGEALFQCTGTVLESEANRSIILTSASLFRSKDFDPKDIKIIVRLSGGQPVDGQIVLYDFHYNLAAVEINKTLPVASFTHINDGLSINPDDLHSSEPSEQPFLRPHRSRSYDLVPGDLVVAIGRFSEKPYDLMAAPGQFRIGHCCEDIDCEELLRASCKITRCGVRGPLINRHAEVIGISFYSLTYTPFLPINVAILWWEQHKKTGQTFRPFLGMTTTDLYAAGLEVLEKVIWKFPSIAKGVLVEKKI